MTNVQNAMYVSAVRIDNIQLLQMLEISGTDAMQNFLKLATFSLSPCLRSSCFVSIIVRWPFRWTPGLC